MARRSTQCPHRCFYYELEWLQILCISTFQPPPQMFTENQTGQSTRNTHCSSLANTDVVPSRPTICDQPWILLPRPDLLKHPSHSRPHPLHKKLHLRYALCQESLQPLQLFRRSYRCAHGLLEVRHAETEPNPIGPILTNGWRFAVRGRLLTINHR